MLGDYELKEPTFKNNGWEFICFSDRPRNSKTWTVWTNYAHHIDPRKTSRHLKILSHNFIYYDMAVYIDAKFRVRCCLDHFVKKNLHPKADLAVMEHPKRKCAYDEAEFCIKIGKDKEEVIRSQINFYKSQGFPRNYGLYAPGIMIKRNSYKTNTFMNSWVNEINNHSYRDIISFPYVLWNQPLTLSLMDFKDTYRRFRSV